MAAYRIFAAIFPLGLLSSEVSAQGISAGSPGPAFKFQFGAQEAAPGYTLVAPQAAYSPTTGYGFEAGSAVTAATGEAAAPLQRGAVTVAAEVGAPFIDVNTMGHELNAALGADAPKQFGDVTHHVEYGSYLQAKCVVRGIQQAKLPLAKFIVDDFGDFDPNHPEPTPATFLLPPDPRRTGGRRGPRPPVPGAN